MPFNLLIAFRFPAPATWQVGSSHQTSPLLPKHMHELPVYSYLWSELDDHQELEQTWGKRNLRASNGQVKCMHSYRRCFSWPGHWSFLLLLPLPMTWSSRDWIFTPGKLSEWRWWWCDHGIYDFRRRNESSANEGNSKLLRTVIPFAHRDTWQEFFFRLLSSQSFADPCFLELGSGLTSLFVAEWLWHQEEREWCNDSFFTASSYCDSPQFNTFALNPLIIKREGRVRRHFFLPSLRMPRILKWLS